MKKNDPFSTPARRRRIIAEFTKKVLKNYCIIACQNIYLFRIHIKSCIIIQCIYRRYKSKVILFNLKYNKLLKATIKIQSIWRMTLAKLLLIKLRKELLLKQQFKLMTVTTNLWLTYKNKLATLARLLMLKLKRQKDESNACILIQRIFRGYRSRCIYYKKYKEYLKCCELKEYLQLRYNAEIVVIKRLKDYMY